MTVEAWAQRNARYSGRGTQARKMPRMLGRAFGAREGRVLFFANWFGDDSRWGDLSAGGPEDSDEHGVTEEGDPAQGIGVRV